MLHGLVADPIPNIRFNVAKSYAVLITTLSRLPAEGSLADAEKSTKPVSPSAEGPDLVQSQIMPNLQKLREDEDVDVRYFATTAAASTGEMMQTSP